MGALPEETDAEAYLAMPIEDIGAAMQRGMGWKKGGAVRRRKARPAAPCKYVQRPHRLGLGAEPAAPEVCPSPPPPARPQRTCRRICCRVRMVRRFESGCRTVDCITMRKSPAVNLVRCHLVLFVTEVVLNNSPHLHQAKASRSRL